MSRRTLLLVAALGAAAAPGLVAWLRPTPVAAAPVARAVTAPRTGEVIAREFGVVPVTRGKYCAKRSYTITSSMQTIPGECTQWKSL